MARLNGFALSILIASALLLSAASSGRSDEKHQNQTSPHRPHSHLQTNIPTPAFTIVVQPAPVQIIQESAPVEKKQPAQKWYQRPSITDWGVLFVTLAYVIISIGLLNATKTQATLAKQSAEIATCTLEETQKVNRIAQRGYLYVANVVIKRPREDYIEIAYPIYNAGTTPTRLLGISESFSVSQTLSPIRPITLTEARFRERRTVIPPNSEIGIGGDWNSPLADEEVHTLNAEGNVFFHGIVMYEDIFGQPRYLGFGFRTRRKLETGSELGMGFIAEEGFNWFN